MIELAIAIEINLFTQLEGLLTFEGEQGDGTIVERDESVLPNSVALQLQDYQVGLWKDVTNPETGVTYRPILFEVADDSLLPVMQTQFGAENIVPVAAWNEDGSQLGTTKVPEVVELVNGEVVVTASATVTGIAKYPIHPLYLMCMPDDVEYDVAVAMVNGVPQVTKTETSRTATTQPKDVIRKAGRPPRDWGTYV